MKLVVVLTFISTALFPQMKMDTSRPKIIYVYDALCGWCYGFSPVMQKLHENYKDSLGFNVISGGMLVGENAGPVSARAAFIKKAYRDVERATGIKFGKQFLEVTLEEGKAEFNSLPPSIAMSVFKSKIPTRAVDFASAMQRSIYYDGIHPTDTLHFSVLAESLGFAKEEFVEKMKDPKFRTEAEKDFETAAALRVSGFPTVFLLRGREMTVLSRGYVSYAELEETLKEALSH